MFVCTHNLCALVFVCPELRVKKKQKPPHRGNEQTNMSLPPYLEIPSPVSEGLLEPRDQLSEQRFSLPKQRTVELQEVMGTEAVVAAERGTCLWSSLSSPSVFSPP